MAKKQRPGFMLYHEDVDDLGMLEAEDFKRLFLALARFSETGEQETLGGGLDVLYRLMLRKISKQDEAYEAACQQRQKAAESRWGARNVDAGACETMREDTEACESMREDTEACESMREDAGACETMRDDASACETMRDDAKHANRNLNLNLNMNLSPQNIEKQSVTRARGRGDGDRRRNTGQVCPKAAGGGRKRGAVSDGRDIHAHRAAWVCQSGAGGRSRRVRPQSEHSGRAEHPAVMGADGRGEGRVRRLLS